MVPNWNLSHQRQDLNQGEEGNRSSHVALDNHFEQQLHNHHLSFSHPLAPMSNFEVTELTWENGQLAMHELGGIFPTPTTSTPTSALPKSNWGGVGRASDTLESIIHQATYYNNQQTPNLSPASAPQQNSIHHSRENIGSSVVASSGGKWAENSAHIQTKVGPLPPPPSGSDNKRTRSDSGNCAARNNTNGFEMSACASENATFCKNNNNNNDNTMMTWTSFESPRSCTRTKTTTDEDSACHGGSENQEEERETKGETGRSYTRKGRAAAVHNQSERRRRDRINQKMKALQKLVPNASKTDKASMLDEVIDYLKQLQAQVQMMTSARFMPQLMMPLGMQQHLHQMSLLASMGMGAGLGLGLGTLDATTMNGAHLGQAISGILHPNQVATSAPAFVPPAFVVPQMIPSANQQPNPADPGTNSSATLQDPYSALLAQSMNIELYKRMAALQRQQQQQTTTQHTNSQLQPNHQVQKS